MSGALLGRIRKKGDAIRVAVMLALLATERNSLVHSGAQNLPGH